MDNWHPCVVYDMAIAQHTEDVRRGEETRRVGARRAGRPARSRLAAAFLALAVRLDPVPDRQRRAATPSGA